MGDQIQPCLIQFLTFQASLVEPPYLMVTKVFDNI